MRTHLIAAPIIMLYFWLLTSIPEIALMIVIVVYAVAYLYPIYLLYKHSRAKKTG